ncbi:hypothetical protein [Aquimarina sp. 2201CG14-23]|uniref:hypothetical protein n=1 Tax=Aquimarina mycalae TaxID=3040073 RepID=UPI002477FEDF|nr:hypothetical protein [Aquimarina sp. 2201CG14-23]MDH7446297.1 hypothetical protein [Aquimarina sp. 2201CG14-23]
MKKLMYVAVFGMALGFTSCGEDDVINFACDTIDSELRAPVVAALAAYNDATTQTEALCSAAKSAIETYRATDCGAADAYATELAALPADCSTVGN